MFTITVENSFDAEHSLLLPDGTRESLHLHRWKVKISVCSDLLDETGCVMDFHFLQSIVAEKLSLLSGTVLERLEFFASSGINPSAENVSKYIYDNINPELPDYVKLESVRVMEASDCWAKYTK